MSVGHAFEHEVADRLRCEGLDVWPQEPRMRRTSSGKFIPIADAPVDLLVLARDGRRWAVECKTTHAKSWPLKDLKPHQAQRLDECERSGTPGVVLLRFMLPPKPRTFVLPWSALGPRWHSWASPQGTIKPVASVSLAEAAHLGLESFTLLEALGLMWARRRAA